MLKHFLSIPRFLSLGWPLTYFGQWTKAYVTMCWVRSGTLGFHTPCLLPWKPCYRHTNKPELASWRMTSDEVAYRHHLWMASLQEASSWQHMPTKARRNAHLSPESWAKWMLFGWFLIQEMLINTACTPTATVCLVSLQRKRQRSCKQLFLFLPQLLFILLTLQFQVVLHPSENFLQRDENILYDKGRSSVFSFP